MKNILLTLALLFTSTVYANTHYEQALQLFKDKKYEESLIIFEKLSENDLSNQKINFYLGRIMYEMGEYDLAIMYYERILFTEPSNSRTQLEIAQSYLKLKNYVQALKEFKTVLNKKDVPETVKQNIQQRLDYIDRTMQKHFFSGVLMFNYILDSNTNNGTEGTIYYNNLPTTGTAPKEDYTTQLISVLNHKYKYNEQTSIESSFTLFSQGYNTVADKNIDVFILSTKPTYTNGKNRYSLQLSLDKIRYNDSNLYAGYNMDFGYGRVVSGRAINETNFKVSKKLHSQQADKLKNSHVYELKNSTKYKTDKYGLFNLTTTLAKEIEIDSSATNVSKQSYDLSLSNTYPLPKKYILTTTASAKKTLYDDFNTGFSNTRTDTSKTLIVDLKKILSKNMILGVSGTRLYNESNQGSYDYDKYQIKTTFIYTF